MPTGPSPNPPPPDLWQVMFVVYGLYSVPAIGGAILVCLVLFLCNMLYRRSLKQRSLRKARVAAEEAEKARMQAEKDAADAGERAREEAEAAQRAKEAAAATCIQSWARGKASRIFAKQWAIDKKEREEAAALAAKEAAEKKAAEEEAARKAAEEKAAAEKAAAEKAAAEKAAAEQAVREETAKALAAMPAPTLIKNHTRGGVNDAKRELERFWESVGMLPPSA